MLLHTLNKSPVIVSDCVICLAHKELNKDIMELKSDTNYWNNIVIDLQTYRQTNESIC